MWDCWRCLVAFSDIFCFWFRFTCDGAMFPFINSAAKRSSATSALSLLHCIWSLLFFFRPFFPPSNSNDVNEKTLTFHHKKRQRSESHFLVFTSKRRLLIPWADPLIQSLIYSFVHSFSQWSVALKVLLPPYIYRLFHNPPQLCSIFF